ncbi:MAG: hypothetical protein MJ016_01160 [Victivallaceae bacterium]|nr:hypothetical protein [Victivallaceae bacterium]
MNFLTVLKMILGDSVPLPVPLPVKPDSAAKKPAANPKSTPKTTSKSTPRQAAPAGNWRNGIGKKCTPPDSITVYSPKNSPLKLDSAHIKASGGEGIIYTPPINNADILVKIYRNDASRNREKMHELKKRIYAMSALTEVKKQPCFAWPRMPVFDAQRHMIGFAMNNFNGTSFLSLMGGSRDFQRRFPQWDRLTLAQIALDFIRKLNFLAKHGVLVNDFNPQNFLVDDTGKVSFIDCDSFQISDAGGCHITKTFFPSHIAPELLKDKSALTQPRGIHQLEFGAAIIVFQVLMCGLHPYNYYDPSRQSACGTPDENLLHGRCPLGIGAGCRFPSGNWYNLWSWLTGDIKGAFIATFRDGHGNPAARTTLEAWEKHLINLCTVIKYNPERRTLMPMQPKSSDYIGNRTFPDFKKTSGF